MKKAFSVLGMVSGIAVVVLGFLMLFGVLGGNTSSATSSSYLYPSGYATFGADFYTYVSNNAAEAASASRVAANNLNTIAKTIRTGSGILLIGFGMMLLCLFGSRLGAMKDAEVNQAKLNDRIKDSVEQALESKKDLFVKPEVKEENIADELPTL